MTWTLYASPRSPFVRKVMIAAHETGLAGRLTRIEVVTTPMTPAPELAAVNPLGMIPVLLTEEGPVFDSLVILDLFDEIAGGLFPKGAARRDTLTRHALANGMMDKAVRILDEQFRLQNDDTAQHVAGYVRAIRSGIRWLEPMLDEARFDAGDIALAALMAYLDMRFPQILWREGAERAAAWYAAVEKRPSMQATAFAEPPFV
ncbi:glutathione S-transferase family protein [Pararhodobacter marinus]|uniref:glutathione S-transferase family protein n=1 Tax=Pararhodobacter marinus TaxID=2184063 RepID=UPI003514700D